MRCFVFFGLSRFLNWTEEGESSDVQEAKRRVRKGAPLIGEVTGEIEAY